MSHCETCLTVGHLSHSFIIVVLKCCSGALPSGLHHPRRHLVRVTIGRRPAILHIAFALFLGVPGNANGSSSIGHPILKVTDGAGLMLPCQALLISLAIFSNVLRGDFAKGLADLGDDVIATLLELQKGFGSSLVLRSKN